MAKISKQQRKYILNIAVLVLVTVAAFTFILKDNPKAIFQALATSDVKYILIAFGIMIAVYMTEGVILTILAKLYRRDYKYYKGLLNCMIGVFFSGITPSNSGGQFAQAYTFSKQKVKVTNAASILFMHFIVYQIVLVIFGGIVMITKFNEMRAVTSTIEILGINFDIISLAVIGFICNVFVIAFLIFLACSSWFHKFCIKYGVGLLHKLHIIKDKEKKILEINTKVETFRIEFKRLISNIWVMITCTILFAVKMMLVSSIPYFVAKGLHVEFKSNDIFRNIIDTISMTQFTTTITGMVPIPGASGISELVFQLMFKNFFVDVNASQMSAIILVWRLITFYFGLFAGFFVFLLYHEKPSTSEAFKGDPRRTLLELQVINVETEKTKTIELAALSTASKPRIMEPELLTVEDIEKHFEEVKKDLQLTLDRNDRAVNRENKKKNSKTTSTTKKKTTSKKKTETKTKKTTKTTKKKAPESVTVAVEFKDNYYEETAKIIHAETKAERELKKTSETTRVDKMDEKDIEATNEFNTVQSSGNAIDPTEIVNNNDIKQTIDTEKDGKEE